MQSSIKHFLAITISLTSWFTNAQQVVIEPKPEQPIIEKGEHYNYLNFDFVIRNSSKDTLKLTRLEVHLLDKNNQLIQQKFLDNNGTAPSINTIPDRQWNGVAESLIFNPFHEVNNLTTKLEYTFTFNDSIEVKKVVTPTDYKQSVAFDLPLKSKMLVYDGHDFYSHHRRFNYEFPMIKQLGFNGNFMRFAYDFVILNKENKQYKGDGEKDSDWFGFGADVLAVADGEIIVLETNQKDDKSFDIPSLKTNPLVLYGNHIVIKHQDGAYSMYGHLKQGSSATLKKGQQIKKGQKIGQIGTSGSSFFPHLHFEMRNNTNHDAEGLPSYFDNYSVHIGTIKKEVKRGMINTGDILQSK
ncbi:M23 family metallopeptidase [Flavobacterium sp.]|uniref:M23 family metallopeptidase n=1 Tax=Flavobacterium sp. TaxID=239 RepID=UPI0028BE0DD3|nr:M23 family metallopeptidase [Flavobacterium sp.]